MYIALQKIGIAFFYYSRFCLVVCTQYYVCTRILRRASTSERLEGLGDGHALRHSLLRLVVHTDQLGHELEYLAEQVARDNHNSFQWIAENDISLKQSR